MARSTAATSSAERRPRQLSSSTQDVYMAKNTGGTRAAPALDALVV